MLYIAEVFQPDLEYIIGIFDNKQIAIEEAIKWIHLHDSEYDEWDFRILYRELNKVYDPFNHTAV
jgi:hypothetical protein